MWFGVEVINYHQKVRIIENEAKFQILTLPKVKL